MSSQAPTARLVKTIRQNETLRVSNVRYSDGEFTKSPLEAINYLSDVLSPGSQKVDLCSNRTEESTGFFVLPNETENVDQICSLEGMKTALDACSLSKYLDQMVSIQCYCRNGGNRSKNITKFSFKHVFSTAMYQSCGRKGLVFFSRNPARKAILRLNLSE